MKNNTAINNIQLYNILRSIGLNTSQKGTKFIIKAINIIVLNNDEFVVLNNIYQNISNNYSNLSPKQIKDNISYSLDSRNKQKSKANFEKIFGFAYDNSIFTNKTFIEEICRILK